MSTDDTSGGGGGAHMHANAQPSPAVLELRDQKHKLQSQLLEHAGKNSLETSL